MTAPLRILLVEDNPADAQLVERELRRTDLAVDLRRVETTAALGDALRAFTPDLVLSDFRLRGFTGMDALALVKQESPATPLLIVTGTLDEETAAECIKAGAADYVLKDHLVRLGPAIRGALALKESQVERATAEAALRAKERRFRALIEHSADAIALFGADGKILYGSPATTRVLGYPLEEFEGHSAFDFVHPQDQEFVTGRLSEAARRPGGQVEIWAHVRHKDGSWRFLEGVLTNLLHDPNVGAIVNNYRDATERRQSQQAQTATYRIAENAIAARHLDDLLLAIHDIVRGLMPADNFFIALHDPERDTLSFPYFVDEKDGVRSPDMPVATRPVGKSLTDFVLRSGAPLLATPQVRREMERGGWAERRGTEPLDWLGVPLILGDQVIGVMAVQSYSEAVRYGEREWQILQFLSTQVAQAIDRKRAEQALRASEDRYRAFIAQSSEAIWRFELEQPCPVGLPPEEQVGHIYRHAFLAECNDAMARMYGLTSAAELVGTRLGALRSPDRLENHEMLLRFVRAGYRLADVESRERDRAGRERVFRNNMLGVVEADTLVRAWGTQRDVTDQHLLENQLRQAQKMEAVGRLAGGVAHDFNNILTAITGYCHLLLADMGADDARRDDLEEIRKAADRAAALTRQLLAFSRQQVLQPRVFDLNAVVAGLERLLQRLIGEDVGLATALARDLGSVRADPGQIEQVIMNLAVNARDAMPKGGRLTIETGNVTLDEYYAAEHGVVAPGDYVLLAVSDTGTGMDAETRARIFEPFFTTKARGKGTGLGLATAYGIVKQSGGFIWVYTEPGHGTTFKIYLPRVDAPPEDLESSREDGGAARGTETILLAEDEDAVRYLARQVLTRYGYTVLEARNGEAALDVAARHDGPMQLLVTDVVMPGMSGRELAERLTAGRPNMRVLYMSGYTDDAVVRHGMLEAGIAYLQKPFHPEDLAGKVRQVLDTGP